MWRQALENLKSLFPSSGGVGEIIDTGEASRAKRSYCRVELEADGFTDAASRPILSRKSADRHCATPDWAREALAFDVRNWRSEILKFGAMRSRRWTIGLGLAAALSTVFWILLLDVAHASLDADGGAPGPIGMTGWITLAGLHTLICMGVASKFFDDDFKPGTKAKLWIDAVHESAVIRGGVQRALDTELLDRIRDAASNAAPAAPDQDTQGQNDPKDELTLTLDLWRIAERGFRNIVFRYDAFRQVTRFAVGTRGGEAASRDMLVLLPLTGLVAFALDTLRQRGEFSLLYDGDLASGDARGVIVFTALMIGAVAATLMRLEFHRRAKRYANQYLLALSSGYLDALPGRSRLSGDVCRPNPGPSPNGRHEVARGAPEIERIKREVAADLNHAPASVVEQVLGAYDSVARRKLSDFDQTDAIRDGYQALQRRVRVSGGFSSEASPETVAPGEPQPKWRAKPEGPEAIGVRFDAAPAGFRYFDPTP